jgi:hypothetical protein
LDFAHTKDVWLGLRCASSTRHRGNQDELKPLLRLIHMSS